MLGPGPELMVTPTLDREVVHGQMALSASLTCSTPG